jgi:H+-transporting ATPase
LKLSFPALQTLSLLALAFGSEGALYALRDRKHIWSSRPGTWVLVASAVDILILSLLAVRGIAMHSLPFSTVACVLLGALVFAFLLDLIKAPTFRRLQIA